MIEEEEVEAGDDGDFSLFGESFLTMKKTSTWKSFFPATTSLPVEWKIS